MMAARSNGSLRPATGRQEDLQIALAAIRNGQASMIDNRRVIAWLERFVRRIDRQVSRPGRGKRRRRSG
jgi:hypothetical protein